MKIVWKYIGGCSGDFVVDINIKITVLKVQSKDLISRVYTFFGTGNPNLRSISKPEVELMVFLRMRCNKITKNGKKCP